MVPSEIQLTELTLPLTGSAGTLDLWHQGSLLPLSVSIPFDLERKSRDLLNLGMRDLQSPRVTGGQAERSPFTPDTKQENPR